MSASDLYVLGIETSCDDTAAAVVLRRADGSRRILSNEVWTQHDDHSAYGGVVPEIAARSHVERLDATIEKAVAASGIGYDNNRRCCGRVVRQDGEAFGAGFARRTHG